MKKIPFLLLGLIVTATMTFAQDLPPIIWEMEAPASNLTFSADGETMYTGGQNEVPPYSYGNIKKWDVLSGTEIYTLNGSDSGAIGRTNALAVSPDGSAFASGHGKTSCPAEGPCVDIAVGFHLWDAVSGSSQFSLEEDDIDGLVQSVAFSHDGEFVAFVMSRTNEQQIRVYNFPEYTLQGTYEGHGSGTYCAAFSPSDNLLATGGWDGTVKLWDVETQQLVRTIVHGSYTNGGYPVSLAFSPDGAQLAVSGRGYALNATVWDVSSGDPVHSLSAGAGQFGTSSATVAFSPNGNYLVAGVSRYISPSWGGLIRIWDMADGSLVREYTEEPIGSVGSNLVVAISPMANDWIAYTYDDKIKFAETGLDFEAREVDLTTPVSDTPGTFEFVGAVPNPFNPQTTVHFNLPETRGVRLDVYDVQGRLVKSLLNEVRSAGQNQVTWDGRDQTGRGAASGTYFARLEAGPITSVKAMVLVR